MSAPPDQRQLAATFAEISRVLLAEPDVQRTLAKMCELTVPTVEGCDYAVVTVLTDQRHTTPAASHVTGQTVEAIQLEVGEGPSVEAIRNTRRSSRTTWNRAALAVVLPPRRRVDRVRSMLAFRMSVADDTIGSLNLYPRSPPLHRGLAGGGDDRRRPRSRPQAAQTKESLARLREVIEARELFSQAKGILMGRQGISSQAARDLLCQGASARRWS